MTAAAAKVDMQAGREADVCLIVEGCYPYVPGGVSAWIDWLMRTQPQTSFSIVSLWPRPAETPARYKLPENVVSFEHLYLQDLGRRPSRVAVETEELHGLAEALGALTMEGGSAALATVSERLAGLRRKVDIADLFNSEAAWQVALDMYRLEMPYGSFLHYFWAWRALLGGLFAVLEAPLPKARIYHTISTGYAGLLAARAALETGRPALLTEHGIYTNERRIELLMADWVADTVDKGHALSDPRFDLRDMWVRAFESYARTCYEAATEVVTLYEDNQRLQKVLGADPGKLRVIANGIDVERFGAVTPVAPGTPPTIALIGRVVPIKDVETFITTAHLLKPKVPGLKALILGPTDEDAEYVARCRQLIADLGLEGTVEMTGTVNVLEWLPRIHVVVLTSLSESQPLVVLEAGAAGIPFVATNVGSCREIIEGRPDEEPRLGAGGFVTDLVAPEQLAAAIAGLLGDEAKRRRMGETLRQRVRTYYRSEQAVSAYERLYGRLMELRDGAMAAAGGGSG